MQDKTKVNFYNACRMVTDKDVRWNRIEIINLFLTIKKYQLLNSKWQIILYFKVDKKTLTWNSVCLTYSSPNMLWGMSFWLIEGKVKIKRPNMIKDWETPITFVSELAKMRGRSFSVRLKVLHTIQDILPVSSNSKRIKEYLSNNILRRLYRSLRSLSNYQCKQNRQFFF